MEKKNTLKINTIDKSQLASVAYFKKPVQKDNVDFEAKNTQTFIKLAITHTNTENANTLPSFGLITAFI